MLSKALFTVTIGNQGVAIALHLGQKIQDMLFVESLTPESESEIKQLFSKAKRAPISILIDIADQNYKKKTYPQVNRIDLSRIIARDLKKEVSNDPDVLKGYLVHKDKVTHKWDCLFVSASKSEDISKWIDFLLQVPNKISGIYMLPLEAFSLVKIILDLTVKESGIVPKSNITFFIIQNKVSGTRQIVFDGNQIVFTRMVYYDFNSSGFAEEFEQDILRTNEYLKRIIPNVKLEDVSVINILPAEVIDKLDDIQNKAVSFINYSPSQISSKIGFSSPESGLEEGFFDFIIASAFANSKKKVLKFSLPKLVLVEKFYIGLNLILATNALLLFFCIAVWAYTFMSLRADDEKALAFAADKNISQQQYDHFKKLILSGDEFADINLDQLMDFGKLNEALTQDNININEFFDKLSFIKNHHATVNSITLAFGDNRFLDGGPQQQNLAEQKNQIRPAPIDPNTKLSLKVAISGTVKIKSGNVEELLKGFDALNKESKSVLSEYNVTYDDLSKDLNFNKKYYDFPVNLRIESK